MRSTPLVSCVLLAAVGLSTPLASQLLPGNYLACRRDNATVPGPAEMYLCSPRTRQVTALTIPTVLQTDFANCVWMDTATTGYVGTFNNPGVYSISIAGTSVTATQLNTAPLAGLNECTQLVRIGATIYVAQWDKFSSVPIGGGAPTLLLDMTTLTGWPAAGIANGIATDGISKIYLAIWTGGQVYVFDTVTKQATLMLTLPFSKAGATSVFAPVNAQMKFPAPLGVLAVGGLNGDVVLIDTATATVTQHYYQPSALGTSQTTSKDSLFELEDSGDWAIGTRDGAIDVLVPIGTDGQLARRDIEGIGSAALPTGNRVVAIWYLRAGASYAAFGNGCAGTAGFPPTSVGRGPALRGNLSFAFGIDSVNANTSGLAALVLGTNRSAPYPIDLTSFGAPGCFLRHDAPVVIGVTTTGTGPGLGWGTLPVPLPNITGTIFTQWISVDALANQLGVAMSDARELKL